MLQLKKRICCYSFLLCWKSFSPLAEKDCCHQQHFFWWSSSKTVSTKNAKMWEIWTISEDRSENRAILFVQIWRKSFSATGKKDFWFYFCATGGKDFLPFAATKNQILQQLFLGLSRTFYTQSYNPFCTKAVLICVNSWNSFLQFKSNLFSFW